MATLTHRRGCADKSHACRGDHPHHTLKPHPTPLCPGIGSIENVCVCVCVCVCCVCVQSRSRGLPCLGNFGLCEIFRYLCFQPLNRKQRIRLAPARVCVRFMEGWIGIRVQYTHTYISSLSVYPNSSKLIDVNVRIHRHRQVRKGGHVHSNICV